MEDVEPATAGLDIILRINPIRYRRVNKNSPRDTDPKYATKSTLIEPRLEIGFDHEQIRDIFPEATRLVNTPRAGAMGTDDEDTEPKLGLSSDALIVALVNAVKELSARITQLERQPTQPARY